jgi:hypothetical protein
MYYWKPIASLVSGVFGSFSFLHDSNIRIAFRAALPSTRNFWVNLSRPFSSWVFHMIVQRDVSILADIIWTFESWFIIPQTMLCGLAEPPCFTNEGFRFPGLLYSGKPCRFVHRVVDSNPSNCFLAGNAISSIRSWPSAPLLHSTMGFSPQVISDSGPAEPQFWFGSNF